MQSFKSDDPESVRSLSQMLEQDRIRANRIPGVRTVLVVLSAAGMVFDMESLRQKIVLSYPEASVFFITTHGNSMGPESPDEVDLLIDFTGPGQRQSLFFAKMLRNFSRVAIGRNAGLFRKKIYDRVFDEKSPEVKSVIESFSREEFVQKNVLALAGVPFVRSSGATPDLAKSIALELPAMNRV